MNQAASEWIPVISGGPQGSILGPLLFLLCINDIPSLVQNKIKMFADDIKIYRTICNDSDTLLLQQDLNQLSEWASNWLLKFSIAKCMVLPLSKPRVTT